MSGRMRHIAGGDAPVSASGNLRFAEVVSRRGLLTGLAAAGALALIRPAAAKSATSPLAFKEVPHGMDETDHVPEGYEKQVLIRWGDPVVAGAPAFDPNNLTAAAQEKQFGYNCDFIGLHPLPVGSTTGDRFLMVVNHEYTDPGLMFAGLAQVVTSTSRRPSRRSRSSWPPTAVR